MAVSTVLIVALAVLAIGLAASLISTRMTMRTLQSRQELNTSFLMAFSSLLAKVAMADGGMSSVEEVAVERMLHGMGLTKAEHAMCLGNFLMCRNDKRSAKTIAAEFSSKMGVDASSLMYALLWRVAKADGRIEHAEESILLDIADAMCLPVHLLAGLRSGSAVELNQLALVRVGVPKELLKLVK